MIDIKIAGGLLFAIIAGVAGYLYGKGKCHKRHEMHEGQFRRHPQMFEGRGEWQK